AEAAEWLRKASAAGDEMAAKLLTELLRSQTSQPRPLTKLAAGQLKCETTDDPQQQLELAFEYARVSRDSEARRCVEMAAEAGLPRAQLESRLVYEGLKLEGTRHNAPCE